jgi:hypothetical protein
MACDASETSDAVLEMRAMFNDPEQSACGLLDVLILKHFVPKA